MFFLTNYVDYRGTILEFLAHIYFLCFVFVPFHSLTFNVVVSCALSITLFLLTIAHLHRYYFGI